jgi:hypothetical protein
MDCPWLPRLWEDEFGATSNPRSARDGKEEEIRWKFQSGLRAFRVSREVFFLFHPPKGGYRWNGVPYSLYRKWGKITHGKSTT